MAKRIERDHATSLSALSRSGSTIEIVRRLVDEPLIELFLSSIQSGFVTSWTQFRAHVSDLGNRLAAWDVAKIAHGNSVNDHVEELDSQLYAILQERGRDRGAEEIRRDAHTMAVAWRVRRERSKPGNFWPASWIVTPDAHMSLAYRRANTSDPDSLTLSASQWVSILSAFADPATIEELASSGAVLLAQETMLRVAARYPAPAVMEIAIALGDGATDTDIRVAQLTMDDLLRDVPDAAADPKRLGITVAAKMLQQRSERLDLAHQIQSERLASERQQLHEEAARAAAEAERERANRVVVERELKEEREARERDEQEAGRSRILLRRRDIRAVAAWGVLVVGVALYVLSTITNGFDGTLIALAMGSLLSVVVFVLLSARWASNVDEDWRGLIWALGPQLLALPGLLKDLGVW